MAPTLSLRGVPRASTAAEICADTLRAALLRGDVAAEDKLPAERELAQQLGVDRGTLRAGLQRLVAQGLLVQRQGVGTVVRDFLATGGLELLLPLVQGARGRARHAHLEDLLLLRRHLATAVLEALAARPANDDARAAVARATVAFAEVVDRHHRGEADDNDVAAADVNVLGAVVAATGRPVLRLALNPVVAVLRGLPALRRAIVADAADSVAAYVALQAWLAAPDARAIPALAALLAARDARTLERLAARSPDDDDDDDNDNDNDDDNDRARRATAPRGGRR